jgi:hypothetical protein
LTVTISKLTERAIQWTGPLPARGVSADDIQTILTHALFAALSKRGCSPSCSWASASCPA